MHRGKVPLVQRWPDRVRVEVATRHGPYSASAIKFPADLEQISDEWCSVEAPEEVSAEAQQHENRAQQSPAAAQSASSAGRARAQKGAPANDEMACANPTAQP